MGPYSHNVKNTKFILLNDIKCIKACIRSLKVGKSMTKVAAIQLKPDFSSSERTINRALRLIEEAANLGTEVVCFPEHWLANSIVTIDKLIAKLSHSAQEYDTAPGFDEDRGKDRKTAKRKRRGCQKS